MLQGAALEPLKYHTGLRRNRNAFIIIVCFGLMNFGYFSHDLSIAWFFIDFLTCNLIWHPSKNMSTNCGEMWQTVEKCDFTICCHVFPQSVVHNLSSHISTVCCHISQQSVVTFLHNLLSHFSTICCHISPQSVVTFLHNLWSYFSLVCCHSPPQSVVAFLHNLLSYLSLICCYISPQSVLKFFHNLLSHFSTICCHISP